MELFDKSFFVQAFDNSPVAQIVVDAQGCVQLFNQSAEILFKYKFEEIHKQSLEILIPSESRSSHFDLVQKFFQDPVPRRMGRGRDLFGVNKDGKRIPIEVGLNPLQNGKELFIVASVVDISERIQNQNRFRDAIEAAPNAMIMVDALGKITLANRQSESLFGYSREEMLGQNVEMLVPESVRPRHPQFVKNFISHPQSRAMGLGRDLNGQRKDGSLFPVEVGLMPIDSEEGVAIISSVVDITERVMAQEKLMAKNEELQQFAYRTSHDLKAPLNSISGLAEFIIMDLENQTSPEEVKQNAGRIIALAHKLLSFISDILNITRADHVELDQEDWIPEDCLQNVKDKLSALFNQSGVNFLFDLKHTRHLCTDSWRINQVIENLVSNAIKYRDTSKENSYVKVVTASDDHFFYIDIEDNGLGIPKDRQSEVFQMFKRFHTSSVEGSGLGLYLVKKLVEKTSGCISFESSNEGTQFHLRFPLTSL